jgi:metallophosphoesterase superfamily enzyme
VAEGYALCGHVHPMIRLEGPHRERARVPVCWIRRDHAVQPSFGSFTGGADIEVAANDNAFAFAAGQVWRVR